MSGLKPTNRDSIGRKETRRASLVFLMSVSFMMVLFSLYGAQASVFEKARDTLLDAAEPVLNILGAPVRWIDARVDNVGNYFDVMEKNRELREKNAELENWMQEAISLRRQVSYYENVLDLKLPPEASTVDARVIGDANGPYNHAMILSAGRRDGVEIGSAVINDKGLMGHVIDAGNSASRILLLTDYNSRTPVLVEGAEIDAILAGRYLDRPELTFFAQRDRASLTEGMRVVTSGAGGKLPRGLLVGEISKVTPEKVSVSLYANYRKSSTVRIIDYAFPDNVEAPEEGELEDGGTDG